MNLNLECDVIITYCWNRVGYNILKSLSNKGLSVWAADTSKHNICSMSRYCSGSFVYPDPFKEEQAFINTLLSKINELKPKVLLPTHDESVVIAKYKDKFPKDLIIPIACHKQLTDLADKEFASKLARRIGVPVPHIYEENEKIDKFPIVCKTKIGNSAKGVFFPNCQDEIENIISTYGRNQLFMEDKVGGVDHSVDCVRYGDFFFASVYRALITKTEGGGTTTQRIIVDCPTLIEYAKRILDEVDYNGVCGLDFRYDEKTGNSFFIEINVRYTGGLATPIAAGFDIPWIHYALVTTGHYNEKINLKLGTKTKWILGDIITFVGRCLSLHFSIKEFKQLCNFNFDALDDFDKTDQKAFWGELSYYFMKLVKNRKLNP